MFEVLKKALAEVHEEIDADLSAVLVDADEAGAEALSKVGQDAHDVVTAAESAFADLEAGWKLPPRNSKPEAKRARKS